MHALVVVANPDPRSLTHAVARRIAAGVAEGGPANSSEIADLSTEGFDPRFTANDLAVHLELARPTRDVLAEQARIDRADALVLVYPVYWWSMPGLLKGWIDRVFTRGWAYDYGREAGVVKKLAGRVVHLVGIGGSDAGTFQRHGYAGAMRTQIDHGIFDYCGARVATSELLLDAHTGDPAAHLEAAHRLGREIVEAIDRRVAVDETGTVTA